MKVIDLIEILEQCDPNAEVIWHDANGENDCPVEAIAELHKKIPIEGKIEEEDEVNEVGDVWITPNSKDFPRDMFQIIR